MGIKVRKLKFQVNEEIVDEHIRVSCKHAAHSFENGYRLSIWRSDHVNRQFGDHLYYIWAYDNKGNQIARVEGVDSVDAQEFVDEIEGRDDIPNYENKILQYEQDDTEYVPKW